MKSIVVLLALACVAACGKDSKFTDAGVSDADVADASVIVPDARPPQPAYEVVGGAGTVRGTRFRADVQIGHGLDQAPAAGAAHAVEGNAAVKP